MATVIKFFLWLYPLLLRFYPRHFREKFGDEMTAVFRQKIRAAAASGPRRIMAVLGRELRDWPASCLREHIWERNHQALLPQTERLSGWAAAAAALPYLLYFVSFNPAFPRYLPPVIIAAGLLAAWWQGWPGWVVSWLGFLIFFGQNLSSTTLLRADPAWNTVPRLLNMFAEVILHAGWLVVMYGVVRRWPRYGALLFLPFVWAPWVFSMEFASEAMTSVVFTAVMLVLALTAVAITLQRTLNGDVWLLYGSTLLAGLLLSLGAVLFSPGMENAWRQFGPNLQEALVPFLGIMLLQSLQAWSREIGRAARRFTRVMAWGTLLAFTALQALDRLIGPSTLVDFQLTLVPILAGVWLAGGILVLAGGWGLRAHFKAAGHRSLASITAILILLPLLYRSPFISGNARTLLYEHPELTTVEALLPALQTADTAIAIGGWAGILLLPLLIGRLRQHTDAFLTSSQSSPLPGWRWRGGKRRDRTKGAGARRFRTRRAALLLAGAALLGGGIFFAAVFLPLQLEAEPYTSQLALGDVDGDGDLDAVLANTMRLLPHADNQILYNDGSGRFAGGQESIGMGGTGVALLDSDADGDLDILMGGMMGGSEFRNDGEHHFVSRPIRISQAPESGASQYTFRTGDLNSDGIADAFMAGCCGIGLSLGPEGMEWIAPVNRVLIGSGSGLVDSDQQLGTRGSQAIDLGDLDGDGDLDAFVGNTQSNDEAMRNDEPNEVWFNDGSGQFSDGSQQLGQQRTYAVALGDVDGDGDLDALTGNEGQDELWLNDGSGRFYQSYQSWSRQTTLAVFLADLDGDGDLDALTGHQTMDSFAWWRQGIIWWNDGSGLFTRGNQRIRYRPNGALTVGDVNGDGRPDLVSGALDEVTVWLNQGNGRFQELAP